MGWTGKINKYEKTETQIDTDFDIIECIDKSFSDKLQKLADYSKSKISDEHKCIKLEYQL